MRSSRVYIVYVKDPSDLIIYLISKSLGNAYLQTVGNANVDSLDYYYYYYLTLGASPSKAPHDRERGMLLAAENRKKIRQVARSRARHSFKEITIE